MKLVFEYLKDRNTEKFNELLACLELQKDLIEEIQEEVANKEAPKVAKSGDMAAMTDLMNLIKELKEKEAEIRLIIEANTELDDKEEENEPQLLPKDYTKYKVNEEVEHNLYKNFTHKRPCAIRIVEEKIQGDSWKDILLIVANYVIKKDEKKFLNLIESQKIKGKKNKWLSTAKEDLRKPEYLEGVKAYIETNLSANSIKNFIKALLKEYKIPVYKCGIYLRADYTNLNKTK